MGMAVEHLPEEAAEVQQEEAAEVQQAEETKAQAEETTGVRPEMTAGRIRRILRSRPSRTTRLPMMVILNDSVYSFWLRRQPGTGCPDKAVQEREIE